MVAAAQRDAAGDNVDLRRQRYSADSVSGKLHAWGDLQRAERKAVHSSALQWYC